MDVTIVTIFSIIAAISGCVIGIVIGLMQDKNKQHRSSHFSSIYKDSEFKQIVDASNKAGKFNSPFIVNDNIIDTIISGGEILAQEAIGIVDIFDEVGDCDERPNWKKLS